MNPILPASGVATPPVARSARPPAAESPAPAARPPPPNPSMRLDPTLGVVVMEFRNGSDEVQRSVPSGPELEAYRLAQRIGRKLEDSGVD